MVRYLTIMIAALMMALVAPAIVSADEIKCELEKEIGDVGRFGPLCCEFEDPTTEQKGCEDDADATDFHACLDGCLNLSMPPCRGFLSGRGLVCGGSCPFVGEECVLGPDRFSCVCVPTR